MGPAQGLGLREEEEEMAAIDALCFLLVPPQAAHSLAAQLHLFGPRDHLMLHPHLVSEGL